MLNGSRFLGTFRGHSKRQQMTIHSKEPRNSEWCSKLFHNLAMLYRPDYTGEIFAGKCFCMRNARIVAHERFCWILLLYSLSQFVEWTSTHWRSGFSVSREITFVFVAHAFRGGLTLGDTFCAKRIFLLSHKLWTRTNQNSFEFEQKRNFG